MKKTYIFLFAFFLVFSCFFALSNCSLSKNTVNSEINIIDSGKYYCMYKYKDDITQVCYNIYDLKGETVFSEKTEQPLRINMLNDNIVDIEIGMGTGLAIHKYYNVEQNLFSQDFPYVLSNQNELVAYLAVSKKSPFDNRKVIVQNVFDKANYYKEFQFDFSNIDTPVIKAEFSKDGLSLQLTYLSGEKQTQITETINLM